MVSNTWNALKSGIHWLGLNLVRVIESGFESVKKGVESVRSGLDGFLFADGFGWGGIKIGVDGMKEGIQGWSENVRWCLEDWSEKVRRSLNITGVLPSLRSVTEKAKKRLRRTLRDFVVENRDVLDQIACEFSGTIMYCEGTKENPYGTVLIRIISVMSLMMVGGWIVKST